MHFGSRDIARDPCASTFVLASCQRCPRWHTVKCRYEAHVCSSFGCPFSRSGSLVSASLELWASSYLFAIQVQHGSRQKTENVQLVASTVLGLLLPILFLCVNVAQKKRFVNGSFTILGVLGPRKCFCGCICLCLSTRPKALLCLLVKIREPFALRCTFGDMPKVGGFFCS